MQFFMGKRMFVQIKEWDGKAVIREGVKLIISRFLMILHMKILNHMLHNILKGEDGLNSRIHIGGSYYISVNSPYKTGSKNVEKGGKWEIFSHKEWYYIDLRGMA